VLASVTVEGDREGQGLVLQEAQACGLPIIATRHGAFPEGVRDPESALLVPERDPGALADAIVQLLQKPERWPEMGRAGRRFVEERFDIRRLNRQLISLYERAAAGYRGDTAEQNRHPSHA
jgi:colanic acid/amylovoran biosynthesis glycosyltransferase